MGYSWIKEKFNKNWIRAIILLENGQFETMTAVYNIDRTFKRGNKPKECAYIVDRKCIHFDKSVPYLWYFEDNPNPLTLSHSKHEFNGRIITSEVFNDVLESKVIKEMVSIGQAESLLLILLIVAIFLGLINIALSSGVINLGQVAINVTNMTNMTNMTNITVV